MKTYDVVIIGGGPAGIIAGATGINQNKEKTFLMIKEEDKGLVPCGIPYIFNDVGDVENNLMGPKPFIDAGGEVMIDRVTTISTEEKTIGTAGGEKIAYDKLIFATGSKAVVPSFIKGYDLQNVEYIHKSYYSMKALKEKTDAAEKIIVIGGGFIGVEVAEQLSKAGKDVSLVEMEKYCLAKAFSEDACQEAEKYITASGVKLYTGKSVKEIIGSQGTAVGVFLNDGSELKADVIIAAIGYRPNVELAEKAGLKLNNSHAIIVDNYLRTSENDIYAVGDCAGTTGFITGHVNNVMLASTATAEARTLAYNLFSIKIRRNMAGTISVFSTEINGKAFASAGAIEHIAERSNIQYVLGRFKDVDRHPDTFSDATELRVKLVVSPVDGAIIGGEICGGKSVGELINIIALAIQKSVTVFELISFQIGTHPLLTGAPTKYALIKAAENAMGNISR